MHQAITQVARVSQLRLDARIEPSTVSVSMSVTMFVFMPMSVSGTEQERVSSSFTTSLNTT